MKPYNRQNIIPASTVMNTTINSTPIQVYNCFVYAIQIVFTGTPTGGFKLQSSNDPAFSSQPGYPANWTDIANSTFTVSAAGNVEWNVEQVGYNWVRVVYTDSSGGTSTAVVSSATFNGKGF